jgi:hypothetical protein
MSAILDETLQHMSAMISLQSILLNLTPDTFAMVNDTWRQLHFDATNRDRHAK